MHSSKYAFKIQIHQNLRISKYVFIKICDHQNMHSSKYKFIKIFVSQNVRSSKYAFKIHVQRQGFEDIFRSAPKPIVLVNLAKPGRNEPKQNKTKPTKTKQNKTKTK